MTDSAGSAAAQVHTRMPVLIAPDDHTRWLTAPADAALALCQAWAGPLVVDHTDQPWAKRAASQPGLLQA